MAVPRMRSLGNKSEHISATQSRPFFLSNGSFQSLVDEATIKNIQRNISLIWYSTVCLKYELLSSVSAISVPITSSIN